LVAGIIDLADTYHTPDHTIRVVELPNLTTAAVKGHQETG
jgi:hypothetical protein